MTRVGLALWVTAAVAALAGCAEPLRRTYTLGSVGDGQAGTRVESQMPVLEIRPIAVPDYLDTRDILLRQGPNEISASTTGQWAERLSFGVAHALAAALAKRLPQLAVTTIPPAIPASRQLLVEIVQFNIDADGRCVLGARWSVVAARAQKPVASEMNSFAVAARSRSDADIAAAMTQAIENLADHIAAVLR